MSVRFLFWMGMMGLFLGAPMRVEACPACKDNINTGQEGLQAAYSATVLLLLAVPFSMVGGFVVWLKRQGVFDAPQISGDPAAHATSADSTIAGDGEAGK